VEQGVAASLAAGVGVVGDIAGSPAAIRARLTAGLAGVSFLEATGIGDGVSVGIDRAREALAALPVREGGVTVGLSPHAPYSAGIGLYRWAMERAKADDRPLTTHLAESPAELAFIERGEGPFRDLLERMNKAGTLPPPAGVGPVTALADELADGADRWLLVHGNFLDDAAISRLADWGCSLAYCPRATAYFGWEDHPYRRLMAAGVNVCLGTDSIICQPPEDDQPLGILGPMRLLYRRDGIDPATLLAMATVNGMRALGMNPAEATLDEGGRLPLASVRIDPSAADPLVAALESDHPVEPVTAASVVNSGDHA
ncbi:MAG: amidohydrolase family protein, partial [Phycisphaeraceae bacterium]|nr:amidohydrolase family protein [Phycisphaeraceae bacterium]